MTHTRRGFRAVATTLTTVAATAGLTVGLNSGLTATAAPTAGAHWPGEPVVLTPIGGGYELESLQGFARAAASGASGPTVDLVVVPSAYGDDPADREENLELAQSRTDQIDAACDAVVASPYTGCTATLAVLLDRADALDPANSAPIRAAGIDGIYVLGGDQGLAMSILAESPAEEAMAAAVARGASLGGTSAGAAVQSRSMINGYVGDLGPWDGLRRGSTLMWWGDDGDAERGLAFGSRRAIFDQHFYQRGRFGRLLSTIASSDERFGGRSLVGVGVDYATGIRSIGDRRLSGVFGPSSVAVVDFETLRARPSWRGANELLSTRGVVTHLLPPGRVGYDLVTRRVTLDGKLVRTPVRREAPPLRAPSARGTVYLGGDVSGDFATGVLPQFVATAQAAHRRGSARIVVISAAPGDRATAEEYAAGLAAAGWRGQVDTWVYGDAWRGLDLAGAAGVVVVGADPVALGPVVEDPSFRRAVRDAFRRAPAFLADQHLSAALGAWWSPKADPTDDNYEDVAIANFRTGDGDWRRGLGLVTGSVVPRLTYDYRWGRLYDLAQHDRSAVPLGVGEETAVVVTRSGARVVGTGSVVRLDGRSGRLWTAPNGAIGAVNAMLDVLAPGDRL